MMVICTPEDSFLNALVYNFREPEKTVKKGRAKQREVQTLSVSPGLLVYQDGEWKVVRKGLSKAVFEQTVEKIVSLNFSSTFDQGAPLVKWIESFNKAWTSFRVEEEKLLGKSKQQFLRPIGKEEESVKFSSRTSHAWLSNFFATLIYDPTYHIIYPTLESGYVAFKARAARVPEEEVVQFAHTIDPHQVKQDGSDLWDRNSQERDQMAISEMTRLVTLKFAQNPYIADWLRDCSVPLEENSGCNFWGTSYGTTQEIENSNHLGKILQIVREQLQNRSRAV